MVSTAARQMDAHLAACVAHASDAALALATSARRQQPGLLRRG
jgi:hypothetical protein